MRKLLSVLALMLCLLLPLSALSDEAGAGEAAHAAADALAQDQRAVNVFTWTYYIPDEVVENFENVSGIRVNYSPFLGSDDLVAKLSAGSGEYDIVVTSDYIISDLAGGGLLSELDPARIANYGNIDPAYQGKYFDPDNRYTIPYTNTVPLIVYNPDRVPFEIKGFKDLWREEFRGALATVAEWRGIVGMAQKKLGYSYNDFDAAHLEAAGEELIALKPNICVMNDDTPHNALISGDAIAGYMYGSQIVAAREILPQLKVVYPEEGLSFGIDCLIMPKDAPHPDAAYILLNYLLDGEVSAYASSLINYGNCNTAAVEYMSEAFKADDTVNVPAELVANAEMMMPLDKEALSLYDKIWTAFKQA